MIALATREQVKQWLQSASVQFTTTDDPLLDSLIKRVSGVVYGYLSRPNFARHTVTERRDGQQSNAILLREWPVTSVTSVTVGNTIIPQCASLVDAGWYLEPWNSLPPGINQRLVLRGHVFTRGIANVQIVYTAGYSVSNETQIVEDSDHTANVDCFSGAFIQDDGVTYNGNALTKIEIGSPTASQYKVDNAGTYTFNTALDDDPVLISYSYVPAPVNQAVIELIGERYRYKDRIGMSSRSSATGETTSFSLKDIPDAVRLMLQPYQNVVALI